MIAPTGPMMAISPAQIEILQENGINNWRTVTVSPSGRPYRMGLDGRGMLYWEVEFSNSGQCLSGHVERRDWRWKGGGA